MSVCWNLFYRLPSANKHSKKKKKPKKNLKRNSICRLRHFSKGMKRNTSLTVIQSISLPFFDPFLTRVRSFQSRFTSLLSERSLFSQCTDCALSPPYPLPSSFASMVFSPFTVSPSDGAAYFSLLSLVSLLCTSSLFGLSIHLAREAFHS